ncbi:MAG: DNA replication and repair protein RecF [Spirochaetes bacterium]|nr:DNA replication and repair protein RecF [Spirochaetota bacterium]
MSFFSVNTYNFRNLKNAQVDTNAKNVFLIGENGQGKTNFLEAVYVLCFGNSFRTKIDSLFVKEDEKEMSVKGIYKEKQEESIKNTIFLSIVKGKKTIILNEKKIKDRKEIIYNIPCVVFSHDDVYFVNGTPDRRRIFFNQTISLFDCNYLDNLRQYERILRNRNAVLKNNDKEYKGFNTSDFGVLNPLIPHSLGHERASTSRHSLHSEIISVLDTQLAEKGIELIKTREKITEEFNETFSSVISKVLDIDSEIKIVYKPSWGLDSDADKIKKILLSKQEAETALGTTLSGPHRDRFYYYINKKDFTKIASTGQTRLISLALKTAQAEFYKEKTGKKPLVLFDDALLELDKVKKTRFIESFPEYEQAFFTFLPGEEKIIPEREGIFYTVDNGTIRRRSEDCE